MKKRSPNGVLIWYRQSWTVPPKVALSDWADRERILSLESNPTGGRWRTDRVPYLKAILDTISDDAHEVVVFMAPSQAGKTETITNLVGYIIDQDPGPILLIQENLENAKAWSKDRLDPMLRDTPCMRGRISTARGILAQEEVSSNEVLHKSFVGGQLTMVGSNSGAGLSMRPIRYVIGDEVDAWAPSAGEEGDQLSLAEKRTTWFFNRKLVWISSPRIKATSRIEPLYEASDQRHLFVPCPHCGQYQELLWDQFKWDKAADGTHRPETAHFVCIACHQRIEERHRPAMLAGCEWRANYPERTIAGFWLWAAYCPVIGWATLASEYLRDHHNPEAFKVFVNTRLSQSWEEQGDSPAWESIAQRADLYQQWTVPHEVGFLVVGADVQDDRIEFSTWGYGLGEESWLIGHQIIWGNSDLESVFLDFESKAFLAIPQPSRQRMLTPLLAFIDSGAKTQQVYSFVRSRPHIYAIKGSNQQFAPVVGTPSWQDIDYRGKKVQTGVQLWPVGVHRIKKLLYGRLKLPPGGPRSVHFPSGLTDEYFRQLTGEKLVISRTKEEFRKVHANECLDAAVYAYAAAILAGLADPRTNWEQLCPAVEAAHAPAPTLPAPPLIHQPAPAARQMRSGGGMMQELLRR
jgi:phage terminase large subunit GpA-like protein